MKTCIYTATAFIDDTHYDGSHFPSHLTTVSAMDFKTANHRIKSLLKMKYGNDVDLNGFDECLRNNNGMFHGREITIRLNIIEIELNCC